MSESARLPRKLAAILYADVAGYSRLTGENEDATHRTLSEFLDLITSTVDRHRGHVMHYAGDAVLAMFEAVVDALSCATQIQNDLRIRNADVPDDRKVQFRIGVNLGDVIEDRGDIYGDGVNIAARLESLAEPGGICVSDAVRAAVGKKLSIDYVFMGEQAVKNIEEPVRAYCVSMDAVDSGDADQKASDTSSAGSAELSTRPAIAVLPFNNLSGDPEQEYFADGLTEDVITALSLWRSFPVIARNSTFAYKNKSPDIRAVGEELGARYVIEGSVRKSGARIRVSAQLIDSETGHNIWAERFDRSLEDIFELQDEIAQKIAATVEPELGHREQKRSIRKHASILEAWDYFQKGMWLLYKFTDESNVEARAFFERAIRIDPHFSQAYYGLAYSYQLEILHGHTDDRHASVEKLYDFAHRSVALDDDDSTAHLMLGFAYRWMGSHDMAIAEAKKAVELNPNNAWALGALGNFLDLSGHPEEGIPNIQKSFQLNPRDIHGHFFLTVIARAYLNARNYDAAVDWARKAIERRPDHARAHLYLAIGLAYLGRLLEAHTTIQDCERIQPGFADRWVSWREYRNPDDNDHLEEGLRMARTAQAE